MLFENKTGEGVRAGRFTTEADSMVHVIAMASGLQICGILARILHAAQVPAHRAAKMLRISRTAYFETLATPLSAGVGDLSRVDNILAI